MHSTHVVKGARQFVCSGSIKIHGTQIEHQRRSQVCYAVYQQHPGAAHREMPRVVPDRVADITPNRPVVEIGFGQPLAQTQRDQVLPLIKLGQHHVSQAPHQPGLPVLHPILSVTHPRFDLVDDVADPGAEAAYALIAERF